MRAEDKTKEQLITALHELREWVVSLDTDTDLGTMCRPFPEIAMRRRAASFARIVLFAPLFAIVLIWVHMVCSCHAQTPSETSTSAVLEHKILMLRSYGYGRQGPEIYNTKFFSVLFDAGINPADVMIEYLDLNRNGDAEFRAKKRELLLHQYLGKRIDLIVAVEQPAMLFLLEELKDLAPGVPIMTINATVPTDRQASGHRFLQKTVNLDFKGTLERALELFPKTRGVVVVTGNAEQDLAVKTESQQTAALWKDKLEFEYTDHLSMNEIRDQVAHLSPQTIVIYRTINRDRTGQIFVPYNALLEITKVASAPVFGLYDNYVGATGAIGGSVYHITQEAERAAHIALAIIKGDMQLVEPVTSLPSEGVPIFDWQQINRWGGDASRLPPDSIFVNRPPTLWGQYRAAVISTGTLFFVMLLLIAILILNISRRRKAEEALKESESKYRQLFEVESDALFLIEVDTLNILDVNWSTEALYGYDRDELLTMRSSEVSAEQEESSHAIKEEVDHVSVRWHRKKNGTVFPVEIAGTYFILQGKRVHLAAIRDISMRMQVEQSLRESEERWQFALEGAGDGVWDWNAQTNEVIYSRQWKAMLGFEPQEIGSTLDEWDQRLHPDDRRHVYEEIQKHFSGNTDVYVSEHRVKCKDGTYKWILDRGKVIRWMEDGRPLRVIGTHTDITDRKKAEEALYSKEATLRGILNAANESIWLFSPDGYVITANEMGLRRYNKQAGEVIGKHFSEILRTELAQSRLAHLKHTVESGKAVEFEDQRGGIYFHHTLYPVLDSGERVTSVVCFSRDITARKRAEEEQLRLEKQLQQAQKAESLGRMAGAIAHNFNNMLGAVIGNLELALDEASQGSELRTCISEAMHASLRAAKVSRFMLTYLGQTSGKAEPIDLVAAIQEACALLQTSLPANVRLQAELPSHGPIIRADGSHLTQILTNLVSNAVEAIGEREGQIALNIDIVPGPEVPGSKLFPFGWEPKVNKYVCLSIADTGDGIDPEDLDKIFDPFFSTRFAGRGLGLSVVLGLLRTVDGAIAVESHPGHGSTFKVFFPLQEQEDLVLSKDEVRITHSVAEGGLVLVVDDEAMVRNMAESILKRKLGYEVVTARDGFEALEIFRVRKDELSLVLLDLSMPGMNGWETLAALRALRPDIPVVLASGYDESHLMRGDHPERPQAFLHKPYQRSGLETAIYSALKRG
jgi:PAS domain S-box-containing protein